jgi:iron complex outermembrane receptor protein
MKYQKVFSLLFIIINLYAEIAFSEIAPESIEIDIVDQNLQSTDLFSTTSSPPASFKTIQLDSKNYHTVSDVIQSDASVSESYSAIGYSDAIAIRGIPLNSQNNFFRDGLPVMTEAPVQLENKSRVEIIKGTYGLFGGLSSPGGLINYVTVKPSVEQKTVFKTELTQKAQVGFLAETHHAIDDQNNHLFHVILSGTKLQPNLEHAQGSKYLGTFGFSSKINTTLEFSADIEFSHQSQPSQPGQSLLGSRLPSEIEPDKNLNQQSWSLPVEFNNLIGSAQFKKSFTESTQIIFSMLHQNILTNDRLAFPYGCTSEGNFDRYCSDGTFDLYDYRSENEKRNNQVYKLALNHQFIFAQAKNKTNLSIQNRTVTERFNKQAYNYVGVGHIDNSVQLQSDDTLTTENTNKDSTYNDATLLNSTQIGQFGFDLGLKFEQIKKTTVKTDTTQKTDIDQNFFLPWTALSYHFSEYLTYISYSEGLESYVIPNRSSYTFAGQNIPDAISRQYEWGLRRQKDNSSFNLAVFKITRPSIEDSAPNFRIDGQQLYTGLEIEFEQQFNDFKTQFSGLVLEPKKERGELNTLTNGKSLINVPEQRLKIDAGYKLRSLPGLSLNTSFQFSGARFVTVDNNLKIPSWTTINVGSTYEWSKYQSLQFKIENLTDHKYWKESPTQFGHIYLFPGESRKLVLNYTTTIK